MVSELSTLIHNLVLDNPVPAKDLAKAIGKPYSTLLREVNPYDTGAKLGYSLVAARNDAPHVTPGAFQGAGSGVNASVPAMDGRQNGEKEHRA